MKKYNKVIVYRTLVQNHEHYGAIATRFLLKQSENSAKLLKDYTCITKDMIYDNGLKSSQYSY